MYSSNYRSPYGGGASPTRGRGGSPARGGGVSGLRAVKSSPTSSTGGGIPGSVPTISDGEPTFSTSNNTNGTNNNTRNSIGSKAPTSYMSSNNNTGNSPAKRNTVTGSVTRSQQIGSLAPPVSQGGTTGPVLRSGMSNSPVRSSIGRGPGTANGRGNGSSTVSRVGGGLASTASALNISFDSALAGGVRGSYGGASTTGTLGANQHMLIPSIENTYRNLKKLVPQQQQQEGNGVDASPGGGFTAMPKTYVTIVFDLDETLCNNRRAGRALLRPGALDILRSLRALSSTMVYVELILWTASMECVAKPVVERLDPHGAIFDHLIYRDRRWYKETGYTKDLRRLGRSMDRVVILENSPLSVQLNRRNAILVKDFVGGYGSGTDTELIVSKEVLTDWINEIKSEVEKQVVSSVSSLGSTPVGGTNTSGSSPGLSTDASSPSSEINSSSNNGNHPGMVSPPPPSGSPNTANARNNFLTPTKEATPAVEVSPETYEKMGPGLPDFLHRSHCISAGNEVIAKASQNAGGMGRYSAVPGTTSSISPVRGSTLSSSPAGRRFPTLTSSPYGGGARSSSNAAIPRGRPLMYSR